MDVMELERFGTDADENDEDDAALQYMIAQSLLESSKQKETHRGCTPRGGRRSVGHEPRLQIFLSGVTLDKVLRITSLNPLLQIISHQ